VLEKYLLDVRFDTRGANRRRVIIKKDAASNDEAFRIGNALADLADFEGAASIEVVLSGSDGRDVGMIGGIADREHFLDGAVSKGTGYRVDANRA
jgi:hypothetical protein